MSTPKPNLLQEAHMQRPKLTPSRLSILSVSICISTLISGTPAYAEAAKAISAKVEGAAIAGSGVQIDAGKPPSNGKTKANTVLGKEGHNQYPGVAPKPLPKPKKEALEAIGAAKAKAAQ
jgi:hypothetical protein